MEVETQSNLDDLNNYIILPGRLHSGDFSIYEYPDLLVAKRRLSVQQAKPVLKKLGLIDTIFERFETRRSYYLSLIKIHYGDLDRGYNKENPLSLLKFLSLIKWQEGQNILHKMGSLMLTPRQMLDFIALLKSGRVYDGNGKEITQNEVDSILDEMLGIRDPHRGEWLDAKFNRNPLKWLYVQLSGEDYDVRRQTAGLRITYHKIDSEGNLQKVKEPLEDCLMSDVVSGISLEDLSLGYETNAQGLPKTRLPLYGPDKRHSYFHPRGNSVSYVYATWGSSGLKHRWPRRTTKETSLYDISMGVREAKVRS